MAGPCGHSYEDENGEWHRDLTDEQYSKALADGKLNHLLPKEFVDKINESKKIEPSKATSFGINKRSLSKLAKEIGIEEPKEGTVPTVQEQVDMGRKLLKAGVNVDDVVDFFNEHEAVNGNMISVVRAHVEELTRIRNKTIDDRVLLVKEKKFKEADKKFNEIENISKEISKYEQDVLAKMASKSSESLRAWIGENEINTDNVEDLTAAFKKQVGGRELTKEEQKKVDEASAKSKKTKEQEQGVVKKISKAFEGIKKVSIDIKSYFEGKKDNKFTPEEAKAIWEHAKENYIDKGIGFEETVIKLVADTGLTAKQIISAIATPKSARKLSQEALKIQSNRRKAIANAKSIIAEANKSGIGKIIAKTNKFTTAVATAYHGTVGVFTHASGYIKKPSEYRKFFNFIKETYKFSFGAAASKDILAQYHTKILDLKSHERYDFWDKQKLAIDPDKFYDETEAANNFFKAASEIGERGFNCLKPFRLALAEGYYEKLTPEERKDTERIKAIVDLVNHSTGAFKKLKMNEGAQTVLSTAFFAPNLKLAKLFYNVVDPAKAIWSMKRYTKLSPAEKYKARITLIDAGERIGMTIAFLAINQFILSASGSKKKVNIFNPHESDWLKFKGGDIEVDTEAGAQWGTKTVFALAYNMKTAWTNQKDPYGNYKTPDDKDAETLGQQVRFSLSPLGGIVWDFATGRTAMDRPLPFAKGQKATKKHPRYTALEYLGSKGPIPLAEGMDVFVEGMRKSGMKDPEIVDYLNNSLKAIGTAAAAGVIGIKVKGSKEVSEGKKMSIQEMYNQLNKSTSSSGNAQEMYNQLKNAK